MLDNLKKSKIDFRFQPKRKKAKKYQIRNPSVKNFIIVVIYIGLTEMSYRRDTCFPSVMMVKEALERTCSNQGLKGIRKYVTVHSGAVFIKTRGHPFFVEIFTSQISTFAQKLVN